MLFHIRHAGELLQRKAYSIRELYYTINGKLYPDDLGKTMPFKEFTTSCVQACSPPPLR